MTTSTVKLLTYYLIHFLIQARMSLSLPDHGDQVGFKPESSQSQSTSLVPVTEMELLTYYIIMIRFPRLLLE